MVYVSMLAIAPLAWLVAIVAALVGEWAALLFALPLLTTRQAYKSVVEIRQMFTQTIRALSSAVDARDRYTANHSQRVQEIAVTIGKQMRCSEEEIEALVWGGLLHDIGKIGVDDAVLKKPDRLSAAEQAIIRTHPVLGARILEPVAFLAPHVPVVELHHERPDGRGYPHGLTGERIPVEARIVHVADAYDAMTSSRPYRPARSPDEAIAELQQFRGTQFDASAVDALVAVIVDQHPDIDSRRAERGVTRVA
jgi:putative nucleotidyltransferase with HDIG domain